MDDTRIDTRWLTVFTEVNRRMAKSLDESFGLSMTQFRILLELGAGGGRLPGAGFANLLLLKPSSVTCALNRLSERGLVTRTGAVGDRRSIVVNLTDDGGSLLHAASKRLADVLSAVWANLSEAQRDLVVESTRYPFAELSGHTAVTTDGPVQVFYTTTVVIVLQTWTTLLRSSYGLSLTQFRIMLLLLESNAGLPSGDIALSLILEPSVVSLAVRLPVAAGWLRQERGVRDRRNSLVSLTSEGEELARKALADVSALNARYYAGLPEQDRGPLQETANIIDETLRKGR